MKVYIAGPITGHPDYKNWFNMAEQIFTKHGASVMNPAVLPEGFTDAQYMAIGREMLLACDTIAMLPGWENSKGANLEYHLALYHGKNILEFKYIASPGCYRLVSHIFTPNRNNH